MEAGKAEDEMTANPGTELLDDLRSHLIRLTAALA
jgi:hypothetical protein